MSERKLNDKYNPKEFEEKLYNEWEQKGYFKPSMDKTKESYCIVMPPPNVTSPRKKSYNISRIKRW